jgi:hypothetical protein
MRITIAVLLLTATAGGKCGDEDKGAACVWQF